MNEIGVCNISLSSRVAYDPYDDDPVMGGFVVVDRMSNNTVRDGIDSTLHCVEQTTSTGNQWMLQNKVESRAEVTATKVDLVHRSLGPLVNHQLLTF